MPSRHSTIHTNTLKGFQNLAGNHFLKDQEIYIIVNKSAFPTFAFIFPSRSLTSNKRVKKSTFFSSFQPQSEEEKFPRKSFPLHTLTGNDTTALFATGQPPKPSTTPPWDQDRPLCTGGHPQPQKSQWCRRDNKTIITIITRKKNNVTMEM